MSPGSPHVIDDVSHLAGSGPALPTRAISRGQRQSG
jgi:hypothetical protein